MERRSNAQRIVKKVLKNLLAGGVTLVWVLLLSKNANAFIAQRSQSSGAEVRWGNGAHLVFRSNYTNATGLSEGSVFSILTQSLMRLQRAAMNGFSFTYYQGADPARYPVELNQTFDNQVFFTSAGSAGVKISCNVVALTQVYFDQGGGRAQRTDLRFNDNCVQFTANPLDTGTSNRIYLGDVATHEFGHVLGLDHSQNLQSSMVFTVAPEMSVPSCDEYAGLTYLFGGSSGSATGTLQGSVQSTSGAVFGAHVNAIHLERGVVMGSGITDPSGNFSIGGIEPGTYAVEVEPYYPGSSTLSPYYTGMSNLKCGGSNFQRTFAKSGMLLRTAQVSPSNISSIGQIDVSCQAPSSSTGSAETNFSTAPQLASGNITSPISIQSTFQSSQNGVHYYYLKKQSGYLEAKALAYSLFSPINLDVKFLSTTGAVLAQSTTGDVLSSSFANYINFDPATAINLSQQQDVIVQVSIKGSVPIANFPAGGTAMSQQPYYVLSISRGTGQQATLFPNQARCEDLSGTGTYPNQGEAPLLRSGKEDDSDNSGGCGTIASAQGGGGSGPGSNTRLFNFAALCLALALARQFLLGKPRSKNFSFS